MKQPLPIRRTWRIKSPAKRVDACFGIMDHFDSEQQTCGSPRRPVRVLQFGEGVFMRAFADWMISRMNKYAGFDGDAAVVLPRGINTAAADELNAAGGRYSVVLQSVKDGVPSETIERIDCIRECLNPRTQWDKVLRYACMPEVRYCFSNTTEAGIEYREGADTFPSKVARLLDARCSAGAPGIVFIPCELIEKNGDRLKECVLRYIENRNVREYAEHECRFLNTLVDRIVSGVPDSGSRERLEALTGRAGEIFVCAEAFHFMALEECGKPSGLPFAEAGLNVESTYDVTPYRERKVRLLNGLHTAFSAEAILRGFTCVDEAVSDNVFGGNMRRAAFDEILPGVPLPDAGKRDYAESIFERFMNPFLHHKWRDISMNSVSKWRVRVLPSVEDFLKKNGFAPPILSRSVGSLFAFYMRGGFRDVPEVVEFFERSPSLDDFLGNSSFWGMDLRGISGLETAARTEAAKWL